MKWSIRLTTILNKPITGQKEVYECFNPQLYLDRDQLSHRLLDDWLVLLDGSSVLLEYNIRHIGFSYVYTKGKISKMNPRVTFSLRHTSGQLLKGLLCIVVAVTIVGCFGLNSTNYESRIKALNKVTDENRLYRVAMEDINPEVKAHALKKIKDQSLINTIALECTEPAIRLEATKRVTDQNVLYRIALEDRYVNKLAAMTRLSQGQLARLVDDLKEQAIVMDVIDLLNDQDELRKIFQKNKNLDARKAAFLKLDDNSLSLLSQDVNDPSVGLSAMIRLGHVSWAEAFSAKPGSVWSLGHVIGAAALLDSPQPSHSDVVTACHNFIQLGDESRIPELIYLLNKYGNKSLAEDYMNCGQKQLEDAGCKWGQARGLSCVTGSGSSRVRWGSKR